MMEMTSQKTCLELLHNWFSEFNQDYFGFRLRPPAIRFGVPSNPREYTGYANGEMTIRWDLISGDHPHTKAGPEYAHGRSLLAKDLLLHTMVHEHCVEVLKRPEVNYGGHGPDFRSLANVIGRRLGLTPVRSSKCHPRERHLVSCAHWPFGVRPEGYFLGAFTPRITRRRKSGLDGIVERIERLDLDDRRELMRLLMTGKLA